MAYIIVAIRLNFDAETVTKVPPRNIRYPASETIDMLEHHDKNAGNDVYNAQFNWEEGQKRGGGPSHQRPAGQYTYKDG